MNTNIDIYLEWQAASHPDHQRSEKWYVGAGSFCAVMVAYGIFSGNISMSIVFAFIPALYWLVRNQTHKKHTIKLTSLGVELDGKLTSWGEWKEFWILTGAGYHELHIAPKKISRSELVIQTAEIDPFLIRDILVEFMPQVGDRKERLLDAFIRFCKL